MNISILKSKIHRATVTAVDPGYEGSIVVDADLLDAVGIRKYEKVLVANLSTGDRFETYALPGERDSGEVMLNGATARLGQVGDLVIIFAFASVPEAEVDEFPPRIVQVDEKNRVVRKSLA